VLVYHGFQCSSLRELCVYYWCSNILVRLHLTIAALESCASITGVAIYQVDCTSLPGMESFFNNDSFYLFSFHALLVMSMISQITYHCLIVLVFRGFSVVDLERCASITGVAICRLDCTSLYLP